MWPKAFCNKESLGRKLAMLWFYPSICTLCPFCPFVSVFYGRDKMVTRLNGYQFTSRKRTVLMDLRKKILYSKFLLSLFSIRIRAKTQKQERSRYVMSILYVTTHWSLLDRLKKTSKQPFPYKTPHFLWLNSAISAYSSKFLHFENASLGFLSTWFSLFPIYNLQGRAQASIQLSK